MAAQGGDSGLYQWVSGVIVALLGLIGVIAGKRIKGPTDASHGRRADFESLLEGAATMLDLKDKEIVRLREERDALRGEMMAELEACEKALQKRRDDMHALGNTVMRQNALIQSYVLRFGEIEGLPDQDGDPK